MFSVIVSVPKYISFLDTDGVMWVYIIDENIGEQLKIYPLCNCPCPECKEENVKDRIKTHTVSIMREHNTVEVKCGGCNLTPSKDLRTYLILLDHAQKVRIK